jgi:triacylglycerol lipase
MGGLVEERVMKGSTIACLFALVGCSGTPAEVATQSVDAGGPATIDTPPTQFPKGTADGGAERAPYPIVLCHGLDGFKNIGPINYFYGVADELGKAGYEVYTAQVDAYNSSEIRGAQLQTYVQSVLATSGAKKVNLICHSQGGLDCRYVASNMGDRIASVTTISAPHRGTPIADIVVGDLPGPVEQATDALLNILGAVLSGHGNMNADAALHDLSQAGALDFGQRHPDDPRVAYFSIAGRSNMSMGDDACATPTPAPFLARYDQYADPIDTLLSASGTILSNDVKPPPSNDGLIPVGSARYGTFLGCIPADHLDEMCQIANDSPGAGNPFDCHLFYRQLADFLVAHGF